MIEKLPEVPFQLILRELSFEDRLCLRRVCKKLKALLDGQVFRNLFIFLDCFPFHETLFHTEEPIYYADSCRVPDFNRFILSNYKENLRLLKKLTIFFKGPYKLMDYTDKIELDPESLERDYFFLEVRHLEINLNHLNFFEQAEHLEIKGVGRVFGQLRLKNLRILSVEPRGPRPSDFELDCPALQAMSISYGARPNFTNHLNSLDYLSIKHLLSEGTFDYLVKLFGSCRNLSTIGFQYIGFLEFLLDEVNAGHINLPRWRIIRFERPQYLQGLCDRLADSLVEYEKKIKPERLRIIYNNEELLSSQELLLIIEIHKEFSKFKNLLYNDYLLFLKHNEPLVYISCLYSSIAGLTINHAYSTLEEDAFNEGVVKKLKHIPKFVIKSGPFRINETLFQRMLTTWTKLESFRVDKPSEQIGQHLLDQIPGYWPNLTSLIIGEKPEDIKFLTRFKNLRLLQLKFSLPKEETVLLIRNSSSLYHLNFLNPSTNFRTSLSAEGSKRCKQKRYFKILRTSDRYKLKHYRVKDRQVVESRSRLFSSLEKMLDYYIDYDFFNQRNVSEFTKIKMLFKKML